MKANETNIESIIEGKKQYIVPLFQRAYIWEKKHWQTLWDDIMGLYSSEPSDDNSDENHFFGSFVTMPMENHKEVKEFLLIDGQQRLITLFVLLTVLQNQAEKNNSKALAEEIKQTYLFNTFNDNIPKLLPTQ